MKKVSRFIIAVVALGLSGAALAQVCGPENQVITKPGYYGAVNPEVYQHMTAAIDAKDQAKLGALVKEHAVVQVPAGVPACIITVDFLGYKRRVSISTMALPYWVADDALTEVR